jgi:LmbE family N-acetylglucosaminyl deacetylase
VAAPAPDDPAPPIDVLVVSPHLDDAVLSIGGLLAVVDATGGAATVVTIFAGPAPPGAPSAFVAELHERWALGEEPVVGRRAEDGRALALLGADAVHLDFADAVYRRAPDGTPRYPDWPAVGGGGLRDEDDLVADVARAIGRVVAVRQPAWVLAPLACGGHVDHLAARLAVERLDSAFRASPARWWWYEDLPYTARLGEPPPASVVGLRPHLVALDDRSWRRKLAAVDAYPSQHATVFGDGFLDADGRPTADPAVVLAGHARRVGGGRPAERLWAASPPSAVEVTPPWSIRANSDAV